MSIQADQIFILPANFEQDIKAAFPQMSQKEINRLKVDIECGRITFSKEPATGRIGLLFKAGSQVPPTVIKGSLSVNLSPQLSDEVSEASEAILEPFSTIEGRNWMAERVLDGRDIQFPPTILLLGNGPFENMELGQFLYRYKIRVKLKNLQFNTTYNNVTEWQSLASLFKPIVVLGRIDFTSKALISLLLSAGLRDGGQSFPTNIKYWIKRIDEGDGKCCYLRSKSLENITFISQEMLLAGIFTIGDCAFNFGAPWQNHISHHPALKFVRQLREDIKFLDEAFVWPKTEAEPGEIALGPTDWPQIGMLKFLGYSVGVSGETKTTRQRILRDLFYKVDLPKVDSQAYVDEWGTPESGSRLRKMAQSIAAFCRGARRRDEYAMSLAIEEWEDDLAWLKTTYYDGKFDRQFQWPETTDR